MWYTCILQSKKDQSFFVGTAKDPKQFEALHNKGQIVATKQATPWVLKYNEAYRSKTEAIRREGEIKRKKKKAFILALINGKSKR